MGRTFNSKRKRREQQIKAYIGPRWIVEGDWLFPYYVMLGKFGYRCSCGGNLGKHINKHKCSHISRVLSGHAKSFEQLMMDKLGKSV